MVDVDSSIEIAAKVLLEDPRPGDIYQPLFVDRVAPCGHLQRSRTWQMVWEGPPVDQWFGLEQWSNVEGAGTLFICPSLNYETVQQVDVDVALAMDAYSSDLDVLPWDLVFVTTSGSFRASDLLGLPGLPPFTTCNYRRAE